MDPLRPVSPTSSNVTSLIHAIYEAAYEARDFRTMQFLDWFIKEQGEEEKNAETCSRSTTCTVPIPRVCIRSTASWLRGSILRRR